MAFELNVAGPGGLICAVSLDGAATVFELEACIDARASIPATNQRLFQGTRELVGNRSLAELLPGSERVQQLLLVRRSPRQVWLTEIDSMAPHMLLPWFQRLPGEGWQDKEVALAVIRRAEDRDDLDKIWACITTRSQEIRADPDVFIAALEKDVVNLPFDLTEQHKADRDVMMAACHANPANFQFVSEELAADRGFELASIGSIAGKQFQQHRLFVASCTHGCGKDTEWYCEQLFLCQECQQKQFLWEGRRRQNGLRDAGRDQRRDAELAEPLQAEQSRRDAERAARILEDQARRDAELAAQLQEQEYHGETDAELAARLQGELFQEEPQRLSARPAGPREPDLHPDALVLRPRPMGAQPDGNVRAADLEDDDSAADRQSRGDRSPGGHVQRSSAETAAQMPGRIHPDAEVASRVEGSTNLHEAIPGADPGVSAEAAAQMRGHIHTDAEAASRVEGSTNLREAIPGGDRGASAEAAAQVQ